MKYYLVTDLLTLSKGITQLRFKPAYNPYTEPSMEIFGFHPQLRKWVEIGTASTSVARTDTQREKEIPASLGPRCCALWDYRRTCRSSHGDLAWSGTLFSFFFFSLSTALFRVVDHSQAYHDLIQD